MTLEPIAADRPRTPARRLAERLPQPPGIGLRLRAQTLPLLVIGLVLVAGAAAAGLPGALGWTVTGWTTAVLAVGGWRARRDTVAGSPARRRRRRYLLLVVACGCGWLVLAAAGGPGGWHAVIMVAGGYATAAPTWRRHHIPTRTDPEPEPDPEPESEPEFDAPDWMDLIPEVWAETLAAKDRVLAGSRLAERGSAPTGVTWTIRLAPGRHTTATAVAAGPLIASGLGMPLDRVTVDKHHSGDGDKAHLLVVHEGEGNPLRRKHPFPGVDEALNVETGFARLGVHADLDHALWRVYDLALGARGGIVIGASGSGKSRLLELLGIFLHVLPPGPGVGRRPPGRRLPARAVPPYRLGRIHRGRDRPDVHHRPETDLVPVEDQPAGASRATPDQPRRPHGPDHLG